ncbi:hypothetical protein [Nocardioides sp. R-C-SC26]|uniref:hypothetical protein n=1 Tax=Nocardioides sp. R-C-SC26 TaxID=2870414 RepID=UPI001E5A9280|nr:hypothetical protein [Nocardioides sp. R-C-SC26]
MSVLDTMNAATPPCETIKIALDAALQAEYDAAVAGLNAAVDHDARHASLGDQEPAMTAAVDHADEVRQRWEVSTVTFCFGKVDQPEYLALRAKHLPREGEAFDRVLGYNILTWPSALIRESCVKTIGYDGSELTEIPVATWDHLLGTVDGEGRTVKKGVLNSGTIDRLFGKAVRANEGTSQVPPSARSLLRTQDSGASSTPPSPGESHRSDSEGGSRSGSPTSSGTPKGTRKKGKSSGT